MIVERDIRDIIQKKLIVEREIREIIEIEIEIVIKEDVFMFFFLSLLVLRLVKKIIFGNRFLRKDICK